VPLYEYQCRKCQHRFERIIRKFSEHNPKCPQCGGKVERLLNAPAVQFKGSGWYVTDYARGGADKAKSEGEAAKAEATAESSASKAEEKRDSRPESKPKPEQKKHDKKKS